MKKMITGLALGAVALTHSLAVAASPAAALERAGSPVAESEEMGGGGFFAVIAAIVLGIGIIYLVEEEEDDIPESP